LRFGGGGGYGPPDARDPKAVQNDLRNDYITAEYAKRHYNIE